MQRTLCAAALAAASLLAPVAAMSQEAAGPVQISTTADLARVCDAAQGPTYSYQRGACDGFIGGSGSLYVRLVENKLVANWSCAPANASLDDARRVFVTWAQANPQYASETATDGLWRALNATWPCPKADGPIVPAPSSIVKHKTVKP
ncbi:hypothetical protein SAMN07250955_105283 [Arboricoccus pini]|uniref:Rap1a immunity protein domain-containing protein n=2 Tax=Arboricoccus pini TaxID=1963835 RepID=A0A212R5B9_9PROT|nr:hypothetical protein SAMN07250955_105283 [Arboricoccus pini]